MKRLFIVLSLIGAIHVSTGLSSSASLSNAEKENNNVKLKDELSALEPIFTQLDGNLFLAVQTNEAIVVDDGDIIEFVFGNDKMLISFHINDINQDLIDKGVANLFIMLHHDLVLNLRSYRLNHLNVLHGEKIYRIPVNQFWIPREYLTIQ